MQRAATQCLCGSVRAASCCRCSAPLPPCTDGFATCYAKHQHNAAQRTRAARCSPHTARQACPTCRCQCTQHHNAGWSHTPSAPRHIQQATRTSPPPLSPANGSPTTHHAKEEVQKHNQKVPKLQYSLERGNKYVGMPCWNEILVGLFMV